MTLFVFYVVEISPYNVHIVEGSTLELNCSLRQYSKFPEFNSSDMFFEVLFDGASGLMIVDEKYYVTNGPYTLQLIYPNVSLNDTGTYYCMVNEANGTIRLAGTYVSVGSKLTIHVRLAGTYVSVGSKLTIHI